MAIRSPPIAESRPPFRNLSSDPLSLTHRWQTQTPDDALTYLQERRRDDLAKSGKCVNEFKAHATSSSPFTFVVKSDFIAVLNTRLVANAIKLHWNRASIC